MNSSELASAILAPVRVIIYALFAVIITLMVSLALAGCASKPIIQTQVIEKPVPVPCNIEIPAECREAYSVDRVSPADNPLTINRALRAELEERSACEVKLLAAVRVCNKH